MPARERLYRTEGVVLRRHDLAEADRILTVYTRYLGKIRVVAKGARKPASRKAGHVELFTRVDLQLARGRDLDVVSQVQMLDAFLPLRQDLERSSYASHAIELLDAFTEDADESASLYDLLIDGLTWLSVTSDLRRSARLYELRLLDEVGYRPQLFECVLCGNSIQAENQFYSLADGGVMCPACGSNRPHPRPLSLNALKVLRYLQRQPFSKVEQLNLGQAVQDEIERILYDTLTYHLERRLKSVSFIERLRREAAQ